MSRRRVLFLLPVLLLVVTACSSDGDGEGADPPDVTVDVEVTVAPDDETTTSSTTGAPATTTAVPERAPLAAGDRGAQVQDVQELLNEFVALSDADRGRIAVDGIYGPATERAVTDFERYAGLVEDGVLSGPDSERLRTTVAELDAAAADSVVSSGSSGELVAFWQDRLDTWLELTGSDLAPLLVDGVFGPETLEATTAFQEAAGLQVDGVVEPEDRVVLRDTITELREAVDAAAGG